VRWRRRSRGRRGSTARGLRPLRAQAGVTMVALLTGLDARLRAAECTVVSAGTLRLKPAIAKPL